MAAGHLQARHEAAGELARLTRPAGERGDIVAKVLLHVPAKITKEREEAYNTWYNEEHCPKVLQLSGALTARRYKMIMGEGEYEYLTAYEFPDEATFQRFEESDGDPGALRRLRRGVRRRKRPHPRRLRADLALVVGEKLTLLPHGPPHRYWAGAHSADRGLGLVSAVSRLRCGRRGPSPHRRRNGRVTWRNWPNRERRGRACSARRSSYPAGPVRLLNH